MSQNETNTNVNTNVPLAANADNQKLNALVRMKKRRVLYIVLGIVAALLIFHAGLAAGSHRHSRDRDGFNRRPRAGFFSRLPHGFIEEGHGVVGVVQSVATSSLTIATRSGALQTVYIG